MIIRHILLSIHPSRNREWDTETLLPTQTQNLKKLFKWLFCVEGDSQSIIMLWCIKATNCVDYTTAIPGHCCWCAPSKIYIQSNSVWWLNHNVFYGFMFNSKSILPTFMFSLQVKLLPSNEHAQFMQTVQQLAIPCCCFFSFKELL